MVTASRAAFSWRKHPPNVVQINNRMKNPVMVLVLALVGLFSCAENTPVGNGFLRIEDGFSCAYGYQRGNVEFVNLFVEKQTDTFYRMVEILILRILRLNLLKERTCLSN